MTVVGESSPHTSSTLTSVVLASWGDGKPGHIKPDLPGVANRALRGVAILLARDLGFSSCTLPRTPPAADGEAGGVLALVGGVRSRCAAWSLDALAAAASDRARTTRADKPATKCSTSTALSLWEGRRGDNEPSLAWHEQSTLPNTHTHTPVINRPASQHNAQHKACKSRVHCPHCIGTPHKHAILGTDAWTQLDHTARHSSREPLVELRKAPRLAVSKPRSRL